ncbi:MAG: pyridoxal phosphate-dependent aminotransferase, partial [Candidatus Acidiferrum sp.]
LAAQKSCTRLKMEGGWYAVLKAPSATEDDELALELLTTHGVYIHPGHFYDFPADGYWVVSLITPEQEFVTGIDALLAMFAKSTS